MLGYTNNPHYMNGSDMLLELAIGTGFLFLTVLFQALLFDIIIKNTKWLSVQKIKFLEPFWKAFTLAGVTFCVACVLIIEVWFWALFYIFSGAIPDIETALYFSTSCFTTVGFGDVVMDDKWRLLSSIESMNGFIMFGWATAFIFEIVSHVYKSEGRDINH